MGDGLELMDEFVFRAGESDADVALRKSVDLPDLRIGQPVEVQENEGAIEWRQLADGAVNVLEPFVIRSRGGRVRFRGRGEFLETFQAPQVTSLGTFPGEGGVVRHPVDKGGRLRITAKGGQRAPERQKQFLHQVIAIRAAGEAVGHVVQDARMLGQPAAKKGVSFGVVQEMNGNAP